jgi:hypothetical protein
VPGCGDIFTEETCGDTNMAGHVPDDRYSGLLVDAYRAFRDNPTDTLISWLIGGLILFGMGYLIFTIYGPFASLVNTATGTGTSNKELTEYKNTLCHAQMLCGKYSSVRQECALAGDFNNCVSIKMGNDGMWEYPCTYDGRLINETDRAKVPNTVECWLRNAGLSH